MENIRRTSRILLTTSKKIIKEVRPLENVEKNTLHRTVGDPTNRTLLDYAKTIKKISSKPSSEKSPRLPEWTSRYTFLTFPDGTSTKEHKFFCFADEQLNIPSILRSKTIHHSCDNDAMSDDDQIRKGIKFIFTSLRDAMKKQATS
eukprot:TRINITY_DN13875_c0_g1_i11.p1 TRINITY_DN13875_c0_g1~~TRINITY_DN13875_c0_g1_i11.p1  ORF type:complete len:146 (-),score=21.80 TRINITY_DN13875_c0_g1_i11:127-564(-)